MLLFPKAFVDMILAMEWSSCVILYEESEGLVRLQEVLKISPRKRELKHVIRQLQPGPGGDYRYVVLIRSQKIHANTQIVQFNL